MQRTISVLLTANVGTFATQMRAASASVSDFGTKTANAYEGMDRSAQRGLATVSKLAVGVGVGLVGAVGLAVAASVRFEKEMSNVGAVTGATAGQMEVLRQAAIKAGADTVFSAREAAQAQAELGKAGVSVADIVGGALTASLNLASAGNLDLATAAGLTANAMNIFGLRGSDAAHISDVLAAGANKSAADVGELGMSMQQGGLMAAQMGLSLDETVGVLGMFAQNGLRGSDAGTSFKTMLQRLTPQSAEAKAMMQQLGIEVFDASGKFIGIEAAAEELRTGLGGLSDQQRTTALTTIFGSDAIRAATILMEGGGAAVADWTAKVNDQGYAAELAATKLDNLAGDLEQLKGSLETALIQTGSGANGVLREMVQAVTGVVNAYASLPAPLQHAVAGFAAVSGTALVLAGGIGMLLPHLREVQAALVATGPAGAMAASALGSVLKVAGMAGLVVGLAAAINEVNKKLAGVHSANVPKLTGDLVDFAVKGQASALVSRMFGKDLGGLADDIERVASRSDGAVGHLRFFGDQLRGNQGVTQQARQDIEGLDKALAAMVTGGQANLAADVLKEMDVALRAQGSSVKELLPHLDAYRRAKEEQTAQEKLAAAGTEEGKQALAGVPGVVGPAQDSLAGLNAERERAKQAAEAEKAALDGLTPSMKAYHDAMKEWTAGASIYGEALSAKQAREEASRASLDQTTEAGKKAWQGFKTSSALSLSEYTTALGEQVKANEKFKENFLKVYQTLGPEVAAHIASLGKDGPRLMAEAAALTAEAGTPLRDNIIKLAEQGAAGATSAMQLGLAPMPGQVTATAKATYGGFFSGLSPMPHWAGQQAQQTWSAFTSPLNPLPTYASTTAGAVTTSFGTAIAPMVPNTAGTAAGVSGALRGPLDILPGYAGGTAGAVRDAWGNEIQPTIPRTAEQANAIFTSFRDHVAPAVVAGDQTARDTAAKWLEHLRNTIGPTGAETSGWVGAMIEMLNKLLTGVGKPAIPWSGGRPKSEGWSAAEGAVFEFYAAGGTREDHVAQIAPAGAWRLWAEPETGGEAYIPLAPGKRGRSTEILHDVARRFGMELHEYQEGGLALPNFPRPPTFDPYGDKLGHSARQATQETYDRVVAEAKKILETFAPPLSGGIGWQAMWDALKKRFPNATLTSAYRPGARTAGTGRQSYHALGRAIDVSPWASIADWIIANYMSQTREMIFSPHGNRQIHNGGWHYYSGITRANHWDHVHWAMAHGGILDPKAAAAVGLAAASYDEGGLLRPGYTLAHNGTGRDEYVVPDRRFSGGGGDISLTYSPRIDIDIRVAPGADHGYIAREVQGAVRTALDQHNQRLVEMVRKGVRG